MKFPSFMKSKVFIIALTKARHLPRPEPGQSGPRLPNMFFFF